jgi:hypothetical protein
MTQILNDKYQYIHKMLYNEHGHEGMEFHDTWRDFSFELENHMVDIESPKDCSKFIIESIIADQKAGCPAGLAYHPIFGYFHIWSAGQGPGIGLYEQWDEEKFLKRISILTQEQKEKYLR